jgi:hypothetical protein
MKIFSYITVCLLFVTPLFAQTTLKGTVTDVATKTVLVGASISVEGKIIATTNNSGSFSINCSTVKNITVSFVGTRRGQSLAG